MSDTDDLERQIAELTKEVKKSEIQVSQLRKKKTLDGKIRVDCKGPEYGNGCPHKSFEFFSKKPGFWRCKKCWRFDVDYEKKHTKLFKSAKEYSAYLDLHTKNWDYGPNGESIRINWAGNPLEKKYNEWWERKKITKQSIPKGYSWCNVLNKALKDCENACTTCKNIQGCNKYLRDIERNNQNNFRIKKAAIEKELRLLNKSKQPNIERLAKAKKLKKEREQRKQDKKNLINSLLNPKVTKILCGSCKIEFTQNCYFWAFDGTRWLRQIKDKMEINNPQKRRCDNCYKKGLK